MPASSRLRSWRLGALLAAGISLQVAAHGQSQSHLQTGHALPGFFGLESAVAPDLKPNTFSYRNTTVVYSADKDLDLHGNKLSSSRTIRHTSNVSGFTWMTPWKMLGGNFLMNLEIPLVNSASNPRATTDRSSGVAIGDLFFEPIGLYWIGRDGFFTFRYGAWLPTGGFSATADDNAGKGFLTHQASMGFTHYPDQAHEWHVTVLARYEFHQEMSGANLTPGQDVVLDWAIGRHLGARLNVGLLGYGVWQTSIERGSDSNANLNYYGTAAVGAEVRYAMPDWGGDLFFRGFQEIESFNHTEGQSIQFGLNYKL